ncbi:uncharacterized protein LOC133482371 [Phyllopteryx taeniolatus]|uniref:uncharacterized protein LOC133482371 n=1 Tax=Phyllopteryx taeniolatus TaxID=161469 RepID=UPI002AD27C94|nr:uncharacterized protein LOC133482371 [Phyllopteryx taeniolatus]
MGAEEEANALSRIHSPPSSTAEPESILPASCFVGGATWEIEQVVKEAQKTQPDPKTGPPDCLSSRIQHSSFKPAPSEPEGSLLTDLQLTCCAPCQFPAALGVTSLWTSLPACPPLKDVWAVWKDVRAALNQSAASNSRTVIAPRRPNTSSPGEDWQDTRRRPLRGGYCHILPCSSIVVAWRALCILSLSPLPSAPVSNQPHHHRYLSRPVPGNPRQSIAASPSGTTAHRIQVSHLTPRSLVNSCVSSFSVLPCVPDPRHSCHQASRLFCPLPATCPRRRLPTHPGPPP